MTVEGKSLDAFSTSFNYSAKEIEKEWWKYCRNFGRPVNMRTYYRVIVPSETNTGNVDLMLLARATPQQNGSVFYLGIDTEKIPAAKQATYQRQVRSVIGDFKKGFYLESLQDQLEREEKKAKKLSKQVDRGKDRALQELIRQEQLLENIRQKIKEIYQVQL